MIISPSKHHVDYRQQRLAIVSIDSKFGETQFADIFTLVKDGDDWKTISKIYHVK